MAARSPRGRFATVVICPDLVLYQYDMHHGNRIGASTPLMTSVLAHSARKIC